MAWIPHILLVLITAFALVVMLGSWGVPAPAVPICMDANMRERTRDIMLDGLDDALKQSTIRLFENRLRDREKSPDRIVAGMRNAITAYTRSRDEVLRWKPEECRP